MIDNFLKLHATYEKKALRILLKEFRKMSAKISFDALTKENAEAIIPFAIDNKAMQEALFKVHYTIGKSYGNLEARKLRQEIKKFKPLPLFNETFQKFLLAYYAEFGGAEIKLLTATFIAAIVEEIRKATYENETVVQMRDRIFKKVNSPNFYKWQALRIARTETTFAMNRAKLISGEVSGLTMEKYWIAKIDSRTRDQHAYMNGKKVGQNELFDVGGEKMLHPGDRLNGASGSNLVNCRCTFGYRAKRDSNGQLIWNDEIPNKIQSQDVIIPEGLLEIEEKFGYKVPRDLLANLKENNFKITNNNDGGGYFSNGLKRINIPDLYISRAGTYSRNNIFVHEIGHAVDWQRGLATMPEVKELMDKYRNKYSADRDKLFKSLSSVTKSTSKLAAKNKQIDWKDQADDMGDILKALNNKYGYGHSTQYYSGYLKPEKEFIAHCFQLKYNGTGNKYIKRVDAELHDDMILLLEKLLKK